MKSTLTIDRRKVGSTVKSLMGGTYMKDNVSRFRVLAIAFGCLLAFSISARGAEIPVFCGGKGSITTINGTLKWLNPIVPNTLIISGTCKENVLIRGFNRLTLKAKAGATINDASGGTGFVVDIEDSTDVALEGFAINGGTIGIFCSRFSVCRFDGNTVQGASVAGIQFVQSRGTLDTNTIQRDGTGLVVLESSSVRTFGGNVIQNNQNDGVGVDTGGSFASFGDSIRDNGGSGIGLNHGFALLLGTSVTRNSGNGLTVLAHSSVDFESADVVTNNGASGIFLRDLSYVEFRGPSTVTGNSSGLDVACFPQFPATRGALTNTGGGITNCTEP
jgi:hypothetical protein